MNKKDRSLTEKCKDFICVYSKNFYILDFIIYFGLLDACERIVMQN